VLRVLDEARRLQRRMVAARHRCAGGRSILSGTSCTPPLDRKAKGAMAQRTSQAGRSFS